MTFVRRLGPGFGLKEPGFVSAGCSVIEALLAIRVVGLARTEIAVQKFLPASLDYLKPILPSSRARKQGVGLSEHACRAFQYWS